MGKVLTRHIPGSGIPGTPFTPARARGAPAVLDPGRAEALIDCALINCSESRSGMLMRQLFSIDSMVFLLEGEMDGASHPILLHRQNPSDWMLQSPGVGSGCSLYSSLVPSLLIPGVLLILVAAGPVGISHMGVL